MSDQERFLASQWKPMLSSSSSKKKPFYFFKRFRSLYCFLFRIESIKYIILILGLIVSFLSAYLSYRNINEVVLYNYEKKLKFIDQRVSSAILINFNLLQSLFVFLNMKHHLSRDMLHTYLSFFDFLKDYKALVSVGLVDMSSAGVAPEEYVYSSFNLKAPSFWEDNKTRYLADLKKAPQSHMFIRDRSLDGAFMFLRKDSRLFRDQVFFAYMRFYPLVADIVQDMREDFNMRIYLVGDYVADSTESARSGDKNLIFSREEPYFHKKDTIINREFIHEIAGSFWRFEYEVPMKNEQLYYQPLIILVVNLLIALLLFTITHYLTQKWLSLRSNAERLQRSLTYKQQNLEELQSIVHLGDFSLMYEQEHFIGWSKAMSFFFDMTIPPNSIKAFLMLFHEDFRLKLRMALEELYTQNIPFEFECQYLRNDEAFWAHLSAKNSLDERSRLVIHGVLMDINDRKCYEERIHALAFKDPVTNLSNRHHLTTEAQRLFEDPETSYPLALFFLDLDGFKLINDSLGHTVGDSILRVVAQRLLDIIAKNGFVARISGDEFALLLWGLDSGNTVEYVADRILGSLRAPIQVSGRTYHLSASIGIDVARNKIEGGVESMLKHADLAMFHGRSHKGKNHYQFYSSEMGDEAQEQLRLAAEIHHAIENNEFVMYYQPRLSLKTMEITGAEALIRWQHPKRGLIPPDKFIFLAEEHGSIIDLGNLVIRESCLGALQWRVRGDSIRIAVNLSAKQFVSGSLIEDISGILEKVGLPMHAIEFEITETSAMQNPNMACLIMQQFKSLGIKLSLDDFGTAYSSLAYLKRFPLDYLKIDKSFISGLPGNHEDAAITRAVAALGHSLRLSVIAEGVEQKEQAIFLKENGIDEIQGYVLSKPMPLDQFLVFLEEYRTAPVGDPRFVIRDVLREHEARSVQNKNSSGS